jgi:DnaJ homolog subfamily C member 28
MTEDASSIPSSSRLHVYRADEPLLPAVEGHKPWHTTFKVPSHATASIRYGHIPSTVATASSSTSSTRRSGQTGLTDDDRPRHREREVKKRSEIVGRLTRAKESTLDYRLGITKNIKSGTQARLNPVSVKGWAGLVEARIEVRCVPSVIMKPDRPPPFFFSSEQDKKDSIAPSRAAGSP